MNFPKVFNELILFEPQVILTIIRFICFSKVSNLTKRKIQNHIDFRYSQRILNFKECSVQRDSQSVIKIIKLNLEMIEM
jgi:hypothetical protein